MTVPYVGQPLRRREDVRFLTGAARYLDDLDPPGVAHAAFHRSFYAHARILSVDVEQARAQPGVLAVLTAAELAGLPTLPLVAPEGMAVADVGHPVLARGKVRYVGEPIAVVVAESRAAAEDAAELAAVDYEPLDAVVDPRAPSPFLHDAAPDGVLARWSQTAGDVEGAFARAARVVAQSFSIPRVVAAPIEPRGALAEYDSVADLLTVHCSAQDPHRPLAQLARVLDRPRERLRIVVPDVGGAFGSKGSIGPEVVATAVAAMQLARPVKWAEDRLENFLAAYQGRGLEADVELAVAGDGELLGLRVRLHADVGAYLYSATAIPSHTTAMLLTGAYRIPAVDVELVGTGTTKVPTGPYRGAGRPEAALILERMVDLAARELGLDPVELRRRNFVPPEAFPYETPLGWTYDSGDFERCLDTVLELGELERRREEQRLARADGRVVGIGVGMSVERCGGQWESAEVELTADRRLVVRTGSSPHGQGHETAFAQIAADELGIAPEDVTVRWGDSAEVPPGVGTFASRSLAMGGSAVVVAIRKLKERLAGAEPPLQASARFESPLLFASAAYLAVVEIDRATGALRVLHLAAVDDSGRIVNPLLAEGQVVGATAQGLGQALVEQAPHDADGQPLATSFADYPLLTAWEMPELASRFVETPSPFNPLGAKGVGEGGSIAAPAAVANAVADALAPLGVRHVDLPFTEERLWRALRGGEP
jgi:carbon-monoxide dehydrogenase large subunit